jgi:REP element-mobilizing transposase RayT
MKSYDYSSAGAYFVTMCTHRRVWLFEHPQLCALAKEVWLELPERFACVQLDAFVVMPNHIHGIVDLLEPTDIDQGRTDLNAIVGAFKSIIAVRWLAWISENDPHRSARIWQRGYYERIIRNERQRHIIRCYIENNPRRWAEDRDNLGALVERMDERR